MLKPLHSYVVPRLLRPFSVAEIDILTPAEFKTDLPGARFIVDLTAFNCNSKENVLLSRILYSAYHHQPEGGAVFGKTGGWEESMAAAKMELNVALQLWRRTAFSCIAPNYSAAFQQKLQPCSTKVT